MYGVKMYNKDGEIMRDQSELYSGLDYIVIKNFAAQDGANWLKIVPRDSERRLRYYRALYVDVGQGPKFTHWLNIDEDAFYQEIEETRRVDYQKVLQSS